MSCTTVINSDAIWTYLQLPQFVGFILKAMVLGVVNGSSRCKLPGFIMAISGLHNLMMLTFMPNFPHKG